MNKSEIIRKVSKKAGVPDTEAKKFFEIFLKHASEILKPGESLKVPGVGEFQLRVGQIENRTTEQSGDKFIYSDIIVFVSDGGQDPGESEELLFNVPSGVEEEYQPVDSYFSLSIGKPIIPLRGVRESEFFIPPSGSELKSLLESKIERLIEESEKAVGGKETETIHLKSEEEGAKEAADWEKLGVGNTAEEPPVPARSDFLKTREFENLSWDFGENLSQEIEEESIPDFEKEESYTSTKKESPKEEFEKVSEIPAEGEPLFEEEAEDKIPDEDIFEEIIDEDAVEADFDEDFSHVETKAELGREVEERAEEIGEQQTEPEKIREEKAITYDDTEEEKSKVPVRPEPEEPVLKNFQRVRSLTKEFKTADFEEAKDIEQEKPKKITEVRGGYQKVRRTTAEFDFDLSGIKGLDEIEGPPLKEKKRFNRDYEGYRKRRGIPSFIIAAVVILALTGVIFMYMKLKNASTGTAENKSGVSQKQTKVIERDYDVPVTYPYEKSGKESPENLSKNAEQQTDKNETKENVSNAAGQTKQDVRELREPVNAERIGSYIYKYPQGIVVQVSSWKSKSIALSEVRKYRKAGYTAFAENSEIPGMGLYYRVRVGYFKSLNEAENFAERNQ